VLFAFEGWKSASTAKKSLMSEISPRRLWLFAWLIAIAGVLVRLAWFVQFRDEAGLIYSGHLWAVPDARLPSAAGGYDPFVTARAFAPVYGGMIWVGFNFLTTTTDVQLLVFILQTVMLLLATLLTFALARRVLFGWAALVPPLLITASLALAELPSWITAPQIPLMLSVILAVWLLTLVREGRGIHPTVLTLLAGLTFGVAVLISPAAWLVALPTCWWAFRGVGREQAVLLIAAVLLLPAAWLAVIETQTTEGIPTEQIGHYIDNPDYVPASAESAARRAYNVAAPWNPRFAHGWPAESWNWEHLVPIDVRLNAGYQDTTEILAKVWIALYLLFVLIGCWQLLLEGAGSAARLLMIPALTLPLATFFSPDGSLLRVSALPFLTIALTLGFVWLLERLRPGSADPQEA
jgi:hypothetical protein